MKTGRDKATPTAGRGAGLALGPVDPEAPAEIRELVLRLRRLLARAGFTGVRDIASSSGLGRTTVSDALSGTRAPTWPTVAALLRLCRVSPDSSWQHAQEAAKAAEQARKSVRRTPRSGRTGGTAPTTAAMTAPDRHGPALPGTFSVRAPYGELPPRVRGRDSLLAALERELTEGGGRVQVLHGLGGCGKTTVALRLARYAHDRGHRVFWISGATRDRLSTGMRQIAQQLGVPAHEVEDAWSGRSSATDLVWRALDAAPEPWLLVVDNVDEPTVAAAEDGTVGDGTGWIRPSPAGLTVVTTRIGSPLVWGAEAVCRSVDVLTPEDGAAVLVDFAGAAGPPKDARRLAERLGGLPLALRLAGRYLARTQRGAGLLRHADGPVRDFAGYLRVLDRFGAELLDQGEPGSGPAGEGRSRRLVSQTWEMSLDLLAQQGLPEARTLLRLLSCFGRAPFPVKVLHMAVESGDLFPEAAEQCEAALEALVDLSLLTVENITLAVDRDEQVHLVEPCMTAHPLVLDTNALQLRSGPEPVRTELWRQAALLAEQMASVSDVPSMWKVWQLLVPHVTAALRDVPGTDQESLVPFLRACLGAQRYAASSNNWKLDREVVQLMVARSDALPLDHPLRLGAHRAHHENLRGSARTEAARAHFAELLERLGPDHEHTVLARIGVARALRAEGELAEAERELRAVVGAAPKLPDPPRDVLMAHAVLVNLLGELGKAEEAAHEARSLLAALGTGRDRLDVALAHHAAHALDAAGLLGEAEELYRAILTELEKAAEERSPLYRDMARHLADNYVRQSRGREAMDLLGGLLDRYWSDPDTVAAHRSALVRLLGKRVGLQIEFGEADRAEAELRAVLEDHRLGPDPGDHDVLEARLLLVHVLLRREQPDAAARELDVVEAAMAGSAGSGRVGWLARLWRARCHCAQGSCAEAVTVYDEVITALADDADVARKVAEESADCRRVAGGEVGV